MKDRRKIKLTDFTKCPLNLKELSNLKGGAGNIESFSYSCNSSIDEKKGKDENCTAAQCITYL